ncbi:hypothetical protein P691DRAFT_812935 [Macrolepiota fuliginosa MF-IS2]|uniref:Uncharacterized protein n=1 Tax=Macrolepiota fuliginosa MF-IS2 TaxID=1400762 RepID=A0A9P6C4U2_9AGAR|nr:hypothetical protein P691DRAFT_812935 [Macrolepiota fuliginosa MF-IS2]
MAYNYWNMRILMGVVLCNVTVVLSALYPTQPVAATVFYSGRAAMIEWIDDDRKPRISDIGALAIKLATACDVGFTCLWRDVLGGVTMLAFIRKIWLL